MRIAFIGDQPGKVHHYRWEMFCKYLPDHRFDFYTVKDSIKTKKYDIIYYALFTLINRLPLEHPRIMGSATSWKCIFGENSKQDLKLLRQFEKLSANNLSLCERLGEIRKDVVYLPNSVDVDFFVSENRKFKKPLVVGWVGNKDRGEKNYPFLQKIMEKCSKDIVFKVIATGKSDDAKHLKCREDMLAYYQGLHFYIVTSKYEGTPNPALEAAACGIPLLTTKVGNMPELIEEGRNGFFIEENASSVANGLENLVKISDDDYQLLSRNIRSDIEENWTWKKAMQGYREFFA